LEQDREYVEKLVRLNRIAKVVKGGRRFSFSAVSVVGDRNGQVGYGFGKANYVSDAIRKSLDRAKRNMVRISMRRATIPHPVVGKYKGAQVLLKPASPGTGIIAGGPVRAVMEAAGIKDILSKSMGSANPMNIVKAVFASFGLIMDARATATRRGKALNEFWG
jgi:small subunit ribosomal protein S5